MSDDLADHDPGRSVELANGVGLWVYDDGDATGDVVVLLAGADSPGLRWPAPAVAALCAAGYRVVRLDHRDCGRSTWFGPTDAYDLDDLTTDVSLLLDALGVERAHLLGRSMGGMVGQRLALDHPDRVRTLTLLSTSAAPGDDRLPGPADDFVETMAERLFAGPPRSDPDRVRWLVELDGLLAGTRYEFDETTQRRLAEAEVATGWHGETGHGVAVHGSPSRLDEVGHIVAPTLVIHGTADPVFPIDHGRFLVSRIPGSVLVDIDGLGHEAPAALWAEIMPTLLDHLTRG